VQEHGGDADDEHQASRQRHPANRRRFLGLFDQLWVDFSHNI
jgi:hypothetical protein